MVSHNRIFNDARRNLRVADNQKITWSLQGGSQRGDAKIVNISSSGMLIETDTTVESSANAALNFETSLGENNFLPQTGKAIWYKRLNGKQNKSLCGIKFLEPSQSILARLNQRIQKKIKDGSQPHD